MSRPSLFLVDVFAERAHAGNQLAVVVGETGWSSAQMQGFAREMNFSETTFVASPEPRDDGGYDVRIFTPSQELPFAGHPTLGTAWVIRRFFAPASVEVLLHLGIGPVPVTFEARGQDEVVWMKPRAPGFGVRREAAELAALLGIDPSQIDDRAPCQEVSIGIDFVLLPLRSLGALRALRPATLPKNATGQTLFVFAFCPQTYEPGADLAARMFFDAFGVREDPATGSAGACLAAYLSEHRYFGARAVNVRVQQGYEMERPSCLYLRAEAGGAASVSAGDAASVSAADAASVSAGGATSVSVGGKVVLVACGELA
ncbi:MAG: PhzF family phenazine biosynthesis protein [Deltaproteobacteria bacterium]|nr:PhzF family phenazine biosynthesis protein [Deltaproteobacteria bacterium]